MKKKHVDVRPDETELDPKQKVMTLLQFARKAGKLSHGYEACRKEVLMGHLPLLVLTEDIADNTRDKIMKAVKEAQSNCQVHEFSSREELSAALGLPYTAVIGVLDNNFAKKILSYFER